MSVEAKLKLQIGEFTKNYTAAKSHARKESAEMEAISARSGSGMGAGFDDFGKSVARVAGPLAMLKFASDSVMVSVERQRAALALAAVSNEDLNEQVERLREYAKDPALGFDQLMAGSTRLQSVGFSAEKAEQTMREFGNALALVGGGKEELDGVLLALTQIVAKGTVSAEEINQIAERLPQIRTLMADAFGSADTQVLQDMGLEAEEFIDGVVQAASKLERAQSSAATEMANLADEWKNLMQAIGDAAGPILTPTISMLEKLARAAGDITNLAAGAGESIGLEIGLMLQGLTPEQKEEARKMAREASAKESSGTASEPSGGGNEKTQAEEFAKAKAREKVLEDGRKLSERISDEKEKEIIREREKRSREKEQTRKEVDRLREDAEKGATALLSPEEQARKLRDQLGDSFGVKITGAADIEAGLRKLRGEATAARDKGDVEGEKAALERLNEAQRQVSEFRGMANGSTGPQKQGEFQTLVDEIFNRDPAAEQLRALEDAAREQRESRGLLDSILKKMDEPPPRDTFSFQTDN